MEVTGLEKSKPTLRSIASSFEALKSLANFDAKPLPPEVTKEKAESSNSGTDHFKDAEVGLNLSYTIYLNLPKTDDIAVFNAIFKSLKENFFRR